jgi:hypothetical protein
MGFRQSATVSIGLKIQLEKLVNQINESNYNEIMNIFEYSYIDDQNNDFTHTLRNVLYDLTKNEKKYKEFKNEFSEEIKKRGTIVQLYNGEIDELFDNGYLSEKYLLFPIKEILNTSRRGYGREGINGTYCNLDFNVESIKKDILEKYNWLKDVEVVMMIKQDSE